MEWQEDSGRRVQAGGARDAHCGITFSPLPPNHHLHDLIRLLHVLLQHAHLFKGLVIVLLAPPCLWPMDLLPWPAAIVSLASAESSLPEQSLDVMGVIPGDDIVIETCGYCHLAKQQLQRWERQITHFCMCDQLYRTSLPAKWPSPDPPFPPGLALTSSTCKSLDRSQIATGPEISLTCSGISSAASCTTIDTLGLGELAPSQ